MVGAWLGRYGGGMVRWVWWGARGALPTLLVLSSE